MTSLRSPAATARRSLLAALVAALAAGLVAVVPAAAGTTWPAVLAAAGAVGPGPLAGLGVLWVAGLAAYAVGQSAALPGLRHRQAVGLNLAGCAVGNLVPFGGAAAAAVTTALARRWGFATERVLAGLAVTTAWTALGRVVAGGLALAWWVAAGPGGTVPPGVLVPVAAALVAGGVVVAAEPVTAGAGALAGRLVDRADRLRGRPGRDAAGRYRALARAVRARALSVSRTGRGRLAAAQAAYVVLLAALLGGCLAAAGLPVPFGVAFAAVGLERLATAVPVTPGGAGVAELGLVAVLAAATGPQAAAAVAAGVLLYRLFTFVLEVPAGAAVLAAAGLGRRLPVGGAA